MTTKTALISGISGQDGAYLAKFLLGKGYEVFGTSRDAQLSSYPNLESLKIKDRVSLISMSPVDFRSVLQAITQVKPDEIYNLSGQSSVGLSFSQPVETMESISIGTLNMLESIRFSGINTRFYNASSGECFGHTGDTPATEFTQLRPSSPYAVAKSAAFWEVANYRGAYDLFCCSGLLFNHESPLRPQRFVTQKVVQTAKRIAAGSNEKLRIGDISIERDWGWAPEYVEAMWAMLQQDHPDDYIIASGNTHSLEEFIQIAFDLVNLDYRDYIEVDSSFFRLSDIKVSRADPKKAEHNLGWKAEKGIQDIISCMMNDCLL